MAVAMMRRNVLIDLGEAVSPWKSDVIVCPEEFKRINVQGKVVAVGPEVQALDSMRELESPQIFLEVRLSMVREVQGAEM